MTPQAIGISSLACALFFSTAGVSADDPQAPNSTLSKIFSAEQIKAIEGIFEKLLKSKPEIIEDTLKQSAINKETAKQERLKQVIAENKEALFNDPDSPVGGNKNGKTNLVVFLDPFCGYCHRFHAILQEVSAQDKDLRIIYKDIGILGEESKQAVQEVMAAQRQGKYTEYQDALRKANADSRAVRLGIAEAVGINVDRLQQDVDSKPVRDAIARTEKLAQKLELQGTPAFVVGNIFVGGMVDAKMLAQILEQVRKGTAA